MAFYDPNVTLHAWLLANYYREQDTHDKFAMYADLTQMGMPRKTAFSLVWSPRLWDQFKDDGQLSQYDCTPGGPNVL